MKNKNIRKKAISLFLSFIMLFSMLPTSVFALQNGGGGGIGLDPSTAEVRRTSVSNFFGIRFSLYFAEGIQEEEISSSTEFTPLGQIEGNIILSSGAIVPTYWTGMNIYQRMHNDSSEKGAGEWGYTNAMATSCIKRIDDYTSVITTTAQLPILSDIPEIHQDGGVTESELNEFFMGTDDYDIDNPTDEQKAKLDFKNTIEIANYILAQNGGGSIPYDKSNGKDIDGFRDGTYIDEVGTSHRGVLKLHYEPIYSYNISGTTLAFSLRDALAYNAENPDFNMAKSPSGVDKTGRYGHVPDAFLDQAKRVHLVRPEPHINMGTGNPNFGSKWTPEKAVKGGDIYLNGGVGVVTGGIYGAVPPQIIKSYVYVDSVDADGTVHYKKAAETTIEDATFYVDANGDLTEIPLFEDVDGAEKGLAVLNDVFTTDKDLTVDEKSEWVDTDFKKMLFYIDITKKTGCI